MTKRDLINELLGEVVELVDVYQQVDEDEAWVEVHKEDFLCDVGTVLKRVLDQYDLFIKLKED